MRIGGFVPVDKEGNADWDKAGPNLYEVLRRLCAPGEWHHYEEAGWKIEKVGDVDSIRDEALEDAAAYFDTAECSFCVVANENCGDGCETIAMAIRKYLAMKSKP